VVPSSSVTGDASKLALCLGESVVLRNNILVFTLGSPRTSSGFRKLSRNTRENEIKHDKLLVVEKQFGTDSVSLKTPIVQLCHVYISFFKLLLLKSCPGRRDNTHFINGVQFSHIILATALMGGNNHTTV
jgi:hypothetical protein